MKRHGGQINVTSKAGCGSAFGIYLPASDKNVAVKTQAAAEFFSGSGRILVMDDEEVIRDLAMTVLTQAGYEVKTAMNGQEAIDMYKAGCGLGPAI